MWTREQLKSRAKSVLKVSYWPAFLVSFILSIIGDKAQGINGNASFITNNYGNTNPDYEIASYMIITFMAIFLVVFLVTFAIKIFVGYSISVSGRKFYIDNAKYKCNLNNLGFAFRDNRYWNIIKTMLYTNVIIFLWTLLFIIPGVIKSYAYRMVPYILAENPDIDYKKAVELSNEMTMGHKVDIWVLDLSFIGWYLLGALACGIGVMFVRPYHDATDAELYLELKEIAIEKGIFNETYSEQKVIEQDIILDDQKF